MGRLTAELYRARRYRRPLAVVVLTTVPQSDRPAEGKNHEAPILLETRVPQLLSLLAASLMSETLRGTDTVSYQAPQNRFVLGFPESDAGQTRAALSRITSLLRDRLGVEVCTGMARFPEDGVTLDELLARAEGAWSRAREPQVTASPRLVGNSIPNGQPEPSGALG
jgi:hypothetical protein